MKRLEEIIKRVKQGDKPSWADIAWLIQTIQDQQEELDAWREEGMI